jgi:hypothetical protein
MDCGFARRGGRGAVGGVGDSLSVPFDLPLHWSLQCSLGHSKNVVPRTCSHQDQSRNTRAGSVRVARQAGRRQAATEAMVMTATPDANARGSFGLTS